MNVITSKNAKVFSWTSGEIEIAFEHKSFFKNDINFTEHGNHNWHGDNGIQKTAMSKLLDSYLADAIRQGFCIEM